MVHKVFVGTFNPHCQAIKLDSMHASMVGATKLNWPRGKYLLRVMGVWHATTNLPADVKDASVELVPSRVAFSREGIFGVIQTQVLRAIQAEVL